MTSYQDYATEPDGYYDLSQPLNQIVYPGYVYENNTWGGGLRVPGTTAGYSADRPTSPTWRRPCTTPRSSSRTTSA